jgi:hypothetical protein
LDFRSILLKTSQAQHEKWSQHAVIMDSTDSYVGYKHQVIVTVENDQTQALLGVEQRLTGKYPHNTTIVHINKDNNYEVVYGLNLDEIPKGDLKVIINGHGDSNGVGCSTPNKA